MISQIEAIMKKKIEGAQKLYTILDTIVNVVGSQYQERGVQLDEANEIFLVQLESANILMAVPNGYDFATVLVSSNDGRNVKFAELKVGSNFEINEEYKTSDRELKREIFELYATIITVIESLKAALTVDTDEETTEYDVDVEEVIDEEAEFVGETDHPKDTVEIEEQ